MKHYELKAITSYLKNLKIIKHIKRVDNNTLKIEFDKSNILYFDLTKGNSSIYKSATLVNSKSLNAPFDILLQKKLTNSMINNVSLVQNDRIIRFELDIKSSYKQEKLYLQLEFTGIHTNAIILDSNMIILEALRHISENISSRVVKVGAKLQEVEPKNFLPQEKEIFDIEDYLYQKYAVKESKELETIKKTKLNTLVKEESKLQKIVKSLPQSSELEEESIKLYELANLLLANTHTIKPYQKDLKLIDFEGKEKIIDLSTIANISLHINKLFSMAKRLKQKSKNIHIELDNLNQKIDFIKKTIQIINNAKTINEVEFYMPKKEKNQTKTKKEQNYQEFIVDGYKIMLGRNERENIELLQNAKASDFWFHLQDIPSSHVIVPTQKKDLPEHIIYQAALLCAKFNSPFGGDYLVDYTKRRELKIQTKANVLYNNYKTIKIRVD